MRGTRGLGEGPSPEHSRPRVTPSQSSDALGRAAPGGPVLWHPAPAGALTLRTATGGRRSG